MFFTFLSDVFFSPFVQVLMVPANVIMGVRLTRDCGWISWPLHASHCRSLYWTLSMLNWLEIKSSGKKKMHNSKRERKRREGGREREREEGKEERK